MTQFTIASDREAIGAIGLAPRRDVERRSVEIGYWIGEPFRDMGIATNAVLSVAEYGSTTPDLLKIDGLVFEGNTASTRVFEKCGFPFDGRLRKSVAKDGKTIDTLMYALVKEDT